MVEKRIAEIERMIDDAKRCGCMELISVTLIAEYEDLCDRLDMREAA